MSAQDTYNIMWKNADDLIKKNGLTRSALAQVDNIYKKAKKEKQEAQLVKALIYKLSLTDQLDENMASADIQLQQIEQEIRTASPASAAILHSLLADKYKIYYVQNRYKLYSRTQTIATAPGNVETWTVADFQNRIAAEYEKSLAAEKLLQQTSLQPYEPIITKGNTPNLRPTLFDLLANRALDHFRNEERDLSRPAYVFEIDDPKYFAPAASFIKLKIITSDSSSLHHKALLTFQKLLAFHAKDINPGALIDADINRLQLVKQFGVMENSDTLYLHALQDLVTRYGMVPAATQASYLLAQLHAGKASQYKPLTDSSNRYGYNDAVRICEQVISQPATSEGKSNCVVLLNDIQRKTMNLQTEKVNLPGKPFRTLVQYRNFTQLFLRVLVLPDEIKEASSNNEEAYWKGLLAIKPVRSWNQPLPAMNDHQTHSAEISIDALPVGAYVLLAGLDEDFKRDKNLFAAQSFHVSNISYVNNGADYFVLHRETGYPLTNAAVQVWKTGYDNAQRKNTLARSEKMQTDSNGFFKLAKTVNQNAFRFEISYKNDRLFLDDIQYSIYDYRAADAQVLTTEAYERSQARAFYFTDRSIYRPGQTVYFKGIVITKELRTNRSKIVTGHKATVFLYDANGQALDSLELVTNQFGSYAGTFTLPAHALNGSFHLEAKGLPGQAECSIEEYKRPKFYINFKKITTTYRVNDSIRIRAAAKAYSGITIAGAMVSYRVVREPRFIYPWLYTRWGLPRTQSQQIAHGTAVTNDSGSFTVAFKAIPDRTINIKLDPVFDYKVITDITDINGETRSGETTIPVSYKAYTLQLITKNVVAMDSLRQLNVRTQNLAGEFLRLPVHVTIQRLQAPGRLIRQRFWPAPDQFVLTEDQYLAVFPLDEYRQESDYHYWPVAEKVFELTDTSRADGSFPVRPAFAHDGWYMIEASTTDPSGAVVKDVQYVQLFNSKSGSAPAGGYTWNHIDKPAVSPGEKTSLSIASAATGLYLIRQVDRIVDNDMYNRPGGGNDKVYPAYSFSLLSNERKTETFIPSADDRGGLSIIHFFVKDNRFFRISQPIQVPWSDKELGISYQTFRDKTLPGSEEKWKLQISGYKNEKVAAELLASMYDASLDQFRPHGWQVPDIFPSYNSQADWSGFSNFSAVQSREKYVADDIDRSYQKLYDRLLTFFNQARIPLRGMASNRLEEVRIGAMPSPAAASMAKESMDDMEYDKTVSPVPGIPAQDTAGSPDQQPASQQQDASKIRSNFNETAFFFPQLRTDAAGNIAFEFTMPEALTRWKFQALAHTKDAAFGLSGKELVTQKQLMVQPNTPRFLREGDHLSISTKISNLTTRELTGTIHLQLFDAATMQPVDGLFQNMEANQYFTVDAGKTVVATFTLQVPYQLSEPVIYRFVASAPMGGDKDTTVGKLGEYISDGEEAALPVLTNSLLVMESLPLWLKGNEEKTFHFDKLLASGNSETLKQHVLTIEFSTNPAWYAVQSLPYLAAPANDCSEQAFNRFYANAMAARIANASPRLREIFDKWRQDSTSNAFTGNLDKNPELKSLLLQETPWVLDAKNEAAQQKNIALLFNMSAMGRELSSSLDLLIKYQTGNGGFPWFKGGPDDRFITQYILTGLGRLKKLGAIPSALAEQVNALIKNGLAYADARVREDYDGVLKAKTKPGTSHIGYQQVQYLYLRSFFNETGIPGVSFQAVNYYRKQAQQSWLQHNRMMQGMIAVALQRTGDLKTAGDIIRSLQQNAVINEELGMYWPDNRPGYFWYQAPVETQSLLIEAFTEIKNDPKITDQLKTWLLKQKQTRHWRSSKATADACYALLLRGSDWLSQAPSIQVKLGDKIINSAEQVTAGTGYFKKVYDAPFINPGMGDISLKSTAGTAVPSWGAVYWQYFERLDRIVPAASPLKLSKKLFTQKNTATGLVLSPLTEGNALAVGDKVVVRVLLTVDRDMEYVHLKDMRASCLEPVNVLSGYKWQGGLGYYESTSDASTSFFFNWLPKGSYVFEYPLFVAQSGDFSNGITSVESMYAPEFSSHSEGIRIKVD